VAGRRAGRDSKAEAQAPALSNVVTDSCHDIELSEELCPSLLASSTNDLTVEGCGDERLKVGKRIETSRLALDVVEPPIARQLMAMLAVCLGPRTVRR